MEAQKQDQAYQDNPDEETSITIDISSELLNRSKVAAAKEMLSVEEYICRILEQNVLDETSFTTKKRKVITSEDIERLNQFREQLSRETKGHVFDSTEMLRQEREKRTHYLMGEKDVYDEE